MALAVAFDTHKFVRKLKGAGFNDQQAEALTDAVQEAQTSSDVATKQDIADVRRDMKQHIADVLREISDLRKDTKQDIEEVRREISDLRKDTKQDVEEVRREISDLRKGMDAKYESLRKGMDAKYESLRKDIDTKLANMKFELLRWFFAIALAQTGLLVSLKLFL